MCVRGGGGGRWASKDLLPSSVPDSDAVRAAAMVSQPIQQQIEIEKRRSRADEKE